MIKAIIFDIGGVLVQNLDKIILTKIKDYAFRRNYYRYAKKLDSGEITLKQLERIYPDLKLHNIYIDSAKKSKIDKKIKKIVFRLNKKFKVVYLSNTFKEHYLIRKKQNVFSGFLFGINSYNVKMRKPYRIIYKLLLRKLKLKGEECLFIDDRKDNIKTAGRLKINTILFKNYAQLVRELKEFHLI